MQLTRLSLHAPLAALLPAPVGQVGFGGSYGGMLATWMAVKYPAALDGVIAGSAPVVSFRKRSESYPLLPLDANTNRDNARTLRETVNLDPAYDTGAYAKGVTYDATKAGGAAANCRTNIERSWPSLFDLAKTAQGRETINGVFKLCPTARLNSSSDIYTLAFWLQSSFDYMAMGSYPFPSSYILNGKGELPAYPVRVGCSGALSREPSSLSTTERLAGLRDAAAVFYNYTGASTGACFDTAGSANKETQEDATRWDYLFCGGILQPASRSGPPGDMVGRAALFLFDRAATHAKLWPSSGTSPSPCNQRRTGAPSGGETRRSLSPTGRARRGEDGRRWSAATCPLSSPTESLIPGKTAA